MPAQFHIADVRFFPCASAAEIESRLLEAFERFRRKSLGISEQQFSALEKGGEWAEIMDLICPNQEQTARMRRRAHRLLDIRERASGMGHLGQTERKRLSGLRGGVRLVQLESEHRADEIAAALHAEMPWMDGATSFVWDALHANLRSGAATVRLPPMLLSGPPGVGKSYWARRLAALIGAPLELIDAGNEPAGFAVAGSQKGWATAQPGRPIELILREHIGNPISSWVFAS